MASYPFLYAAAASLLPKLDPDYLKLFSGLPNDMKKEVMEWKEILSNLPSFIETLEFSKEGFLAISKFVFDFHIKKQEKDWKSLVGYMTEFTDHYYSKTKEPIILQSSLSSSLHKSKQTIQESSSEVNLDGELDTSLSRALSSLKAPDVKPLDDLPPQLLPCLAYCALYPQGSTFVRETLIYQWVAEGFLHGDGPWKSSVGEQVKKGNLYFNMLLEKGVFVEPIFAFNGDAYKRIHSCKMHPDIHRAVCGMASNEVLINPGTKKGSAAAVTTRYIALHKEDNAEIQSYEFPLQPTTFMCFIPEINMVNMESLFSKFGELRVLYFAGTQFKELPTEFTAFTKLRCLALSRNTLLKSLDCSKYSRLQTLAVDGCVNLEKVDAAAERLEILQLSHCPELKSFTVTSYLTLEILHIFECPKLESLPKLDNHHLKELVCHNCDSLDLDLGECWGYVNYVEVVGLPKLIELELGHTVTKFLLIANCSNLKSIDNHLQKSINSLETLRIYDCPNLEISSKVLSSMIKLRSIDIKNCPTIMTTTFSNEAIEDLAPWIMNKDREFIIDGQRPTIQEVGLLEEVDAALGPLGKSSGAQTSSYVTFEYSYFKMVSESSKSTEDSKGLPDSCATQVLTLISEIRSFPKWRLEQVKLYCSHLFPKDFEFEKDALVQLWTASGLFLLPLEYFGYSCFDRLFKEGFIIKTRTNILTRMDKYKIDVEEATNLLNQDDSKDRYAFLDEDNGLTGLDKLKCWYLSIVIVSKSISPATFKKLEGIRELRTVLLIHDYGDSLKQIPSSFFEALRCMRALDLSGSHIRELPSSIGNMRQLHFLDLSFTLLERIPESIAGLGELQTLKLKGCKHLHTLPKGMKQLRSLRHLDFDILGQLTSMPKGMGQLTKLQTLTAFIVSEEDGCSITELENLNWLRGSFCISGLEYASGDDAKVAVIVKKEHLTKLHLKWKDSKAYDDSARNKASSTLEFLRPYESLQHLKVSYYPGSDWPDWIQALKNLVSVTLLRCENKQIIGLSNLPNLKHLTLIDINNVTSIDIMNRSLETLTIDGMKKLLFLRTGTGHSTTFISSLEEMRVKHCPKLKGHVLVFSKLKYLEISHCKSWEKMRYQLPKSLNTLVINNCPLLKTRCSGENGGDWLRIWHVPNIWIDMKGFIQENKQTAGNSIKGFGEENEQTADPDYSDSSDIETDHSDDSDKETDHSDDSNDSDTEADRSDDSNDSDS